ncbi:alpha/beta fold hydrolase [Novosphingobium beihaiensis]|uniref:Alpha/beta fold hydrolase n=1 Tax=Novosphingobium beihaiensis TaxID=2930389 RepID=A0ABT0BRE3_9SPHN|nr:alpha/beta hydrolase [Novosphingobium beihaiensis]MCJ2187629.1 alpha/beta fold hydrolase [Novosphingobium beihaiensis]
MMLPSAHSAGIAFESFGEEANETILLIAGLGTTMLRWSVPFCERLAARGYRVIRFDNRDSGRSAHFSSFPPPDFGELARVLMAGEQPTVPYTLADMAADAITLLDRLGIARAHVAGRSMGGMIAQITASDYPARVLSLTSIMSSTGNPALPQAAPGIMALMMRPVPVPAADLDGFLEHGVAFARCIAGSGAPFDAAAHRTLLLEELKRGHAPGGAARQVAAMAVSGDRRARLRTIAVPALVIHGAEDPLIPSAGGVETAAMIPDAELLLIEGMGHDIPAQFEGRIADAIHQTARKGATA